MGVETSLYEDVGGTDGLRRLSERFYGRVLADELLAPVFATFTPSHVELVAVWLAEVFGGPAEFTERHRKRSDMQKWSDGLPALSLPKGPRPSKFGSSIESRKCKSLVAKAKA